MRSRTVVTQALLLRSVDYADADRIVTLLTSRFGKASFIARGARRSKKRFGGSLQPFGLLDVVVTEGATELESLVQAQLSRPFPRILSDLARMGAGFAALELLRELTAEHQPDSTVFATALSLLAALDAEEVAPEPVLLCFQLRLLALLGFAPRLGQCGLCGKRPAAAQAGCFDPRLGTLVCKDCGGAPHRLSGSVRGQLMAATGADWVRVAALAWPERQLAETRDALRGFVEQRIGRKLSAAFMLPVGAAEAVR